MHTYTDMKALFCAYDSCCLRHNYTYIYIYIYIERERERKREREREKGRQKGGDKLMNN